MRAFQRGFFSWILLFLVGIASAQEEKPIKDEHTQQNTTQQRKEPQLMSANTLGLEDAEFWSDPSKAEINVVDQLLIEDYSGVYIGAPATVFLDVRKTLPLIAFRAGTFKDVMAVDFTKHALVTAINLDTNVVYADMAVFEDNMEEPEEPADPANALPGSTVQMRVLELKERLGLPWTPARYLMTSILRERPSNRALTKLEPSESSYKDDEVEKFLEAERLKLGPPAVFPKPDRPWPAYHKTDASPSIPEQAGITLHMERVLVLRQGAECVVRGAFRLPALKQEITPASVKEQDPSSPSAVLGITLLITGADDAAPRLARLQAPSYDAVDPSQTNQLFTGYFTVDLMQIRAIAASPQTYFIYAFSGETMAGPIATALIAEERLPQHPKP